MGLAAEIFPAPPAPDGNLLRLGLVGSWESQLVGLGRLTEFLTPRMLSQSHAVDDMGLYLLFLQRHRVEVGLKLVLERAQAPIPRDHAVARLADACGMACTKAGFGPEWGEFTRSQHEYMDLIDQIDPGAATFRYPVDARSQPWARAELVDIRALERAGKAFDHALWNLVSHLNSIEPLPIDDEDAQETARELRELVLRCRDLVACQEQLTNSLTANVRRYARDARDRGREADVYVAAEAAARVSMDLADRAEAMLDRIVDHFALDLPEAVVPPPVSEMPKLRPELGPPAIKSQQDAQMKWFVDELMARLRPLLRAVVDLDNRAQDWTTPAARQLSLDVARFRSRLGGGRRVPRPST